MSRRGNKKRRSMRRERKLSYDEAIKAFHERYPNRGTCPGPTLLNFIAHFLGREAADQRLREAKDPLKYDNILMERKRKLYEEFKRNKRWREGFEGLPPGWEKEPQEVEEGAGPITYEDLDRHRR